MPNWLRQAHKRTKLTSASTSSSPKNLLKDWERLLSIREWDMMLKLTFSGVRSSSSCSQVSMPITATAMPQYIPKLTGWNSRTFRCWGSGKEAEPSMCYRALEDRCRQTEFKAERAVSSASGKLYFVSAVRLSGGIYQVTKKQLLIWKRKRGNKSQRLQSWLALPHVCSWRHKVNCLSSQ